MHSVQEKRLFFWAIKQVVHGNEKINFAIWNENFFAIWNEKVFAISIFHMIEKKNSSD